MTKSFFWNLTSSFLCVFLVISLAGCGSEAKVKVRDKGNSRMLTAGAGGSPAVPNAPAEVADEVMDKAPGDDAMIADMGGMKNGLFPQMGGGAMASSFGGGLFPQMAGGATTATAAPPTGGSAFSLEGASPSGNSGTEAERAKEEVSNEVASKEEMSKKTVLYDRAIQAFARHEEEDAMNLLYAHVLVADDEVKYPLHMVDKLKEPRVALRWGVGVTFKKAPQVTGRFSVIGDPGGSEGAPSSGGGRSGGRGRLGANFGSGTTRTGARTYRKMDTSRPDGFLMYFTGDFGEALITEMDKRRKSSDAAFGKLLKDIPIVEPAEGTGSSQEDSGDGGGDGNNADLGGGSPPAASSSSAQRDREDASIIERAEGNGDSRKPDDELVGTIIPGLMLVGQGKQPELLQRARDQGLDVMVLFIVNAKQSRSGEKTNLTSMRFIDLRAADNAEPLFRSKQLKDTTVAEALEDDRDMVKREMERAFEFIESAGLLPTELPSSLKETHVKSRLRVLLKKDLPNPLPAVVEVVSFYRLNKLSAENAGIALKKLLDSDQAVDLLSENPEKRMAVLSEWIPSDPEDL